MAFKLVRDNDFQNASLGGMEGDHNDTILDRQDYQRTYPFQLLFPATYMHIFGGSGYVIDVGAHQIYHIKNGQLKIAAGQYGVAGLKDGPGDKAIIGPGGFQESYAGAYDSSGDFYWTDSKTGTIRGIHENPDGSYNVFTYAYYDTTVLCIDADDNMWTVQGTWLIKILPNGTPEYHQIPVGNISQMAAVSNGHILLLTRNNAWDTLWDFNPDDDSTVRLCGISDNEVNQYCVNHGITGDQYFSTNHDGPALGQIGVDDIASFHSPGICWYNADASEVWMNGGDERQLRRYLKSTGRVDSMLLNGGWGESDRRILQDHNNLLWPFYMAQAGGRQENGYPWEFGMNGATSVLKIVKIEVPDQPGETMHSSAFIRQTVPVTMEAGKPAHFSVTWKNTGTIPWSEAEAVHLGTQNPHDNTNFGTNRWNITGGTVVQPGQEYTFEFDAVVAMPGTYNFQTKMVDDAPPNWNWIGQAGPNVAVTVTAAQEEEPMNAIINWDTKTIQNVPNPETFTKWRITIQAPGIPVVFTGNSQITVTIPLPADLAPGSYPVLVERVNTAVTVVAGSATGTMVIPNAGGPVLVPNVVTIVLQ